MSAALAATPAFTAPDVLFGLLHAYALRCDAQLTGWSEAIHEVMDLERVQAVHAGKLTWDPVLRTYADPDAVLHDFDYWGDRLCEMLDTVAATATLQRVLRQFLEDAARWVAIRREWAAKLAEIEEAHPTGSPERRAALRQARADMAKRYGQNWQAPGRRLLVKAAAGVGKTRAAAELIAEMREALGVVHFLTDRTESAEAVATQIPAGAMAVRGRSAPDPKIEGRLMCWRPDAAEAVARAGLPVGQTLCRDAAGRTCPFIDICGYQREQAAQRSGEASVFAGSHQYLTLPGPMLRPDAIVADENIIPTLIGRAEFAPDRLLPTEMDHWQAAGDIAAATAHRDAMGRIAEALRDGAGILAGLRARGFQRAADFKAPIAYLRKVEEADIIGDLRPTMDDAAILDRLDRHRRSEVALILKMLTALQAEIELPRDEAHGVAFRPDKLVTVDGRRERQARVSVHYRKRLSFADDLPMMVLDHSGDLEVYRRHLGQRLEVVEIKAERRAVFVQVYDVTMPTSSLIGTGQEGASADRAARRRGEIVAAANALAAKHGSTFVASAKAVEEAMRPDLSGGVMTGHFGGLRGSNAYAECSVGMVVGRNQPPAWAMEEIARATWSDDPEPLALLTTGEDVTGRYGTETRHIQMRDGSRIPVEVDVHPDPRVQRVLELHRERETEQDADRLRLIHCAEPKLVYLLCNIPVDQAVDRVVSYREFIREVAGRIDNGATGKGRRTYGSRLVEAWRQSGGVLPLVPAELHRMFPNLWSLNAAKQDVGRAGRGIVAMLAGEMEKMTAKDPHSAMGSILRSEDLKPREVRFRLPGQRCPSRAIVSAALADPAAALSALLRRPVTLYEADASEPTPATTPAPAPIPTPATPPALPQEAPVPPPAPAPIHSPALRLASLAMRLEAVRPALDKPASTLTPPRHDWWRDRAMLSVDQAIAAWRQLEREKGPTPGPPPWILPHLATLGLGRHSPEETRP